MVEGPVKIVMAIKEPEDKNLLWMRPYLDKEGYELLYYGSKGWTRLIPCCPLEVPNTQGYLEPLEEISPKEMGDTEGTSYSIASVKSPPDRKTSCGCPN